MTNTNCLENIKCPNCGNEDSFRIAAKTIATVCDDGVEDHSEMEWDDDSYADCTKCCWHGTLKDFMVGRMPEAAVSSPRQRSWSIADRLRKVLSASRSSTTRKKTQTEFTCWWTLNSTSPSSAPTRASLLTYIPKVEWKPSPSSTLSIATLKPTKRRGNSHSVRCSAGMPASNRATSQDG